ncbi:MAG TPA: hypothetical protein VMI56_08275, partial [Reyranella sp.]|nr:hypothetical protein [Reyranella sp.]
MLHLSTIEGWAADRTVRILIAVLWAAFTALVIAVGVVLLPACGLLASLSDMVPVVGWDFCKPSEASAAKAKNDALTQQSQELEIELAKRTLAC